MLYACLNWCGLVFDSDFVDFELLGRNAFKLSRFSYPFMIHWYKVVRTSILV